MTRLHRRQLLDLALQARRQKPGENELIHMQHGLESDGIPGLLLRNYRNAEGILCTIYVYTYTVFTCVHMYMPLMVI